MLRESLSLLDTRGRPPRWVKSVVYLDSTGLTGASCRGKAMAACFPHGSEPGPHSLTVIYSKVGRKSLTKSLLNSLAQKSATYLISLDLLALSSSLTFNGSFSLGDRYLAKGRWSGALLLAKCVVFNMQMHQHVCTHMHTHASVSCGWKPAGLHSSGCARLQLVLELEMDPPCLLGWVHWMFTYALPVMQEFGRLVLTHKDIVGLIRLSPDLLGKGKEQRQLDLPVEQFSSLPPACTFTCPT